MASSLSMVGVKAVSFFCGGSRVERFSEALVPPKKSQNSIKPNIGFPSAARCVVSNTNDARLIALGHAKISAVLRRGDVSKIAKPVVRSIPVDVIDFIRPLSVGNKPCNAVGNRLLAPQPPGFVPVAIGGVESWSSGISCVEHRAFLRLSSHPIVKHIWSCVVPCHVSRFRVICDKLLSNLMGYHFRPLLADTRNYNILSEV